MKKFMKITSILLAAAAMAGCTVGGPAASSGTSASTSSVSADTYVIGIVQLVQHDALDAATQGFQDAVKDALGDNVTFDLQNAAGDSATCATIANSFVSSNVDLIMANATPALQAAAAATSDIPILGTSVTEYSQALDLSNFNGTVGGNISGTSDLAPLDQQAAIFDELIPDAKNIGILYCSAEANSVYQADLVKGYLEDAGKTVTVYTFTDSNDVAAVTQSAAGENDALYIPTDNTAASCAEVIDGIALNAGVPIVAGEEGICKACGIATLSIGYYDLGYLTGEMAVKVLTGEEDISKMAIAYYSNPVKKYDAARCEALGIEVPSDYTAIE